MNDSCGSRTVHGLLKGFSAARFIITIQPDPELFLPGYKGAAFRGGFGYVFKSIVCPRHEQDCIHLRLGEKCVYSETFETPVPPDSTIMRKYPYAPHPFVLVPPLDDRTHFTCDQQLQVGLVLIGRSIHRLPYFIATLDELGRRGVGPRRTRYRILRVESTTNANGDQRQSSILVYDGLRRAVVNPPDILDPQTLNQNQTGKTRASVHFLTPTRIVSDSRLSADLPFTIFARSLIRRLGLLSYFHCGEPANLAVIRELIDAAGAVQVKESHVRWQDWQRYSTRQKSEMKLGGLLGRIVYEGELKPFWPILRAGELIHVGKNTSFGLGMYQVDEG